MMWLTFRQHRSQALLILGTLVVLAAFLLITGLNMAQASHQLGLSDCLVQATDHSSCEPLEQAFTNQFSLLLRFPLLALCLPAILGALVGAPLVAREQEQHTHLLVWMQNVTRLHWLKIKLALILGGGLLIGGVVTVLFNWWYSPFVQFNSPFTGGYFDLAGPVGLASVVLALTLGIATGTLTRRAVLAVFLTITLFLAIRLPVALFLRPNFAPSVTITWPIDQGTPPVPLSTQDWILARGWIDANGKTTNTFNCAASQTVTECLQANGFRGSYLIYQPGERFWLFQWIEAGIYLALSMLALGLTAWLVQRRIA